MAEIVHTRPRDDRCCVWVCPTHGVISEDELAEGINWDAGTSPADGDVAWTDRFYCQRDHQPDEPHEAELIDLRADIALVVALTEEDAGA